MLLDQARPASAPSIHADARLQPAPETLVGRADHDEIERLKGVEQTLDRQVAAVAEAVREEEREAAAAARKKVEEELARETAASKGLNERIQDMEDTAKYMQLHEQKLWPVSS